MPWNRLEHLGDTILSVCVTNLLIECYPGLRVGPSTVRHSLGLHLPYLRLVDDRKYVR